MLNAIEARQLTELCATTYRKELEEILDLINHAALNGNGSIQYSTFEI